MFLPRSVRTGMFWRFGLLDESRPVSVSDCANVVCTLPSDGSMYCGSFSTYVDLSFEQARYSRMSNTTGCRPTIPWRVFSSVDQCPFVVRFTPAESSPSLSKSSSPICFGESTFMPGSPYDMMDFTSPWISRSSDTPYARSAETSIRTPSASMSASTSTSGSSLPSSAARRPASATFGRSASSSRRVTSASSAA